MEGVGCGGVVLVDVVLGYDDVVVGCCVFLFLGYVVVVGLVGVEVGLVG